MRPRQMNRTFFLGLVLAVALLSQALSVLASDNPPPGFRPAWSTYVGPGMGPASRVWVRVASSTSAMVITIWHSPNRYDGQVTNVFRGSCLKPGCMFIYENDPHLKPELRRRILRSHSSKEFILGDWKYTYE